MDKLLKYIDSLLKGNGLNNCEVISFGDGYIIEITIDYSNKLFFGPLKSVLMRRHINIVNELLARYPNIEYRISFNDINIPHSKLQTKIDRGVILEPQFSSYV
jgi:hypothetical protein